MKRLMLFCFLLIAIGLTAQTFHADPLAHTFSIVARDAETGEMGVAVQSHWFSVGTIVSWAEAGVGAIATQSFVNVSFGPRGLALLKEGKSAREVVDILIAQDDARDVRQLAIVDKDGNVAVHTGQKCIAEAGHARGDQFSCQANMMLKNTVWDAMAEAFEASKGEPLAERLVAALEAAQAQGGDIRGKQSASLLVVRAESTGKKWEDRLVDLRVDDHPEAVQEIGRLLKVARAYELMNAGDLAMEHGDEEAALSAYSGAEALFPDNLEMKFWHAVALANIGRVEESLPIFQAVFKEEGHWRILTRRLPDSDLLTVSEENLKLILK